VDSIVKETGGDLVVEQRVVSMSWRRLGWISAMALGVVAFASCLWFVSRNAATRDRIAEAERRNREHAEAVQRIRPIAMAALARIESAATVVDRLEWADKYGWSWVQVDTCGSVGYQEHLVISAEGEDVWWFGTTGIESAEFVDRGQVKSVDASRIVVEWTVSPRTPHVLFDPWQPTPLLSDELVRIQGDGHAYLLPAVRVPLFCASSGRAHPNAAAFALPRGEWRGSGYRGPNVPASDDCQLPAMDAVIPSPWNEYVLPAPLSAAATMIGTPACVLRDRVSRTPLWKRLFGAPDDGWYQCRVRAPLGTADRVKLGMRMRLEPAFGAEGAVDTVDANSCTVEFVMRDRAAALPPTGLTVSSLPR